VPTGSLPEAAPGTAATQAPPGRKRGQSAFRALVPASAVVVLILLLRQSLIFLRDPQSPERVLIWVYERVGLQGNADALRAYGLSPVWGKLMVFVVALLVGVGGVWAVLFVANAVVDRVRGRWRERIRPWIFLGPAIGLIGLYLVYPTISTIVTSLTEQGGAENYRFAFTDPEMLTAFRNNVIWLVLGMGGSVIIGLLIATLVDRVRREALPKTFIFLPLAISMVGASVIWRFVYAWKPSGESQIGLLNAAVTGFGGEPRPWLQTAPINTMLLIVIMIWLQTGFAMVVFSAALKGVPVELIEAARIDGANERQVFFRILLPMIRGTIITVATVICIAVLKVFDIVYVMTGGNFDTDVVANRMFTEMFQFRNFGRASAIAVVLFLMVIPFMIVNIRNLRRQGLAG
jgi:alpha-glucoside transport system permease protein